MIRRRVRGESQKRQHPLPRLPGRFEPALEVKAAQRLQYVRTVGDVGSALPTQVAGGRPRRPLCSRCATYDLAAFRVSTLSSLRTDRTPVTERAA